MDIKRIDTQQRAMRRRYGYVAAGVLVLAIVAIPLLGGNFGKPSVDAASLRTGVVERGDMLREVRGPGRLAAKEVRWIAAETAGRVERVLLQPGSAVGPETVVVKLSNPDVVDRAMAAALAVDVASAELLAREMSLQGQLLDQRAEVLRVEADYESARLQEEGERVLADAQIISRIQARRSALAAAQLKERIVIEKERERILRRAAKAQLQADQSRIDQLVNASKLQARQASSLDVVAGMTGVLQEVSVQEGQQVDGGANLVRLARPDVLLAELRISETQVRDVKAGQAVRVDTRNGTVRGVVSRIDPVVQGGVVNVEVEITGRLPPGARPDMSIDGVIEIERLTDVLFLPRPASARLEGSSSVLRVSQDGGSAERVPVRLGRASVDSVEVVDGLGAGDIVILSDTSKWEAHDRIIID